MTVPKWAKEAAFQMWAWWTFGPRLCARWGTDDYRASWRKQRWFYRKKWVTLAQIAVAHSPQQRKHPRVCRIDKCGRRVCK